MARKTIVTMVDDLDGRPADETVRFGIGGTEYEIDLSKRNATKLRRGLVPFIEHARREGRRTGRPRRTAASRKRSRDIRAWAREQGIELSERGRIPADVAARYDAAGRDTSSQLANGLRPCRRSYGFAGSAHLKCSYEQAGRGEPGGGPHVIPGGPAAQEAVPLSGSGSAVGMDSRQRVVERHVGSACYHDRAGQVKRAASEYPGRRALPPRHHGPDAQYRPADRHLPAGPGGQPAPAAGAADHAGTA